MTSSKFASTHLIRQFREHFDGLQEWKTEAEQTWNFNFFLSLSKRNRYIEN